MQAHNGFDNASSDHAKDDLHRWRFAQNIVDVITGTPPDWSVRIGVFGGWGSGKSTVLRYISDLLKDGDNIVLDFNPAFEENFEGVLGSLYQLVIGELIQRKLYVEPKAKSFLRKSSWWRSSVTSELLNASGDLLKGAKLATSGLAFLNHWLAPTGTQIEKIVTALENKRLVILVDDLDRTTAELLPKMLMSLREAFDLPRFTFVLAFDDAIVREALSKQNAVGAEGQDFLEKILDFRFPLPVADESDRHQLLRKALTEFTPFIPVDSWDEVKDLLPTNPRRLKALVRGFLSLEETIIRHGSDEFQWTDLWLIQILRQETYRVVNALTDEETYNNVLGMYYRMRDLSAGRKEGPSPEDEITAFLLSQGVEGKATARVSRILDAMRSRSSSSISYELGWLRQPPAITWREFDVLRKAWLDAPTGINLRELINAHAIARQELLERVQDEVFTAMHNRIGSLLNGSIFLQTEEPAEEVYKEIASVRLMIRRFFEETTMLTAERYISIYNEAMQWILMRRVGLELSARHAERELLLDLADVMNGDTRVAAFEKLAPWTHPSHALPWEEGGVRKDLRNEIASKLKQTVVERLIAFLRTRSSFRRLGEQGRYMAYKGILFFEAHAWPPELEPALLELCRLGRCDHHIYDDLHEFFDLINRGLNYRGGDLSSESATMLLRRRVLIREIWLTLQSRTTLEQGTIWLLAIREKFLAAEVSPDDLPYAEGWEPNIDAFAQNRNNIMKNF